MDKHIRPIENFHIVLWLLKDLCWVMDFKWMGTFMILPTIIVAIWITYKTRKYLSEFVHNIAVVCWICANSVWMLGEFFFKDGTRPLAAVFFILGLVTLFVYYIKRFLFDKQSH